MSEPDYLRQTGEWAGDDARPLVCEQWNSRHQRSAPEPVPEADAIEALAEIIARARRCHGEPPAVCRCFGACDCADEARKIISALPRPAVDPGRLDLSIKSIRRCVELANAGELSLQAAARQIGIDIEVLAAAREGAK